MAKRTATEIPASFCRKLSTQRQHTLSHLGNYTNGANSIQRYYMLGYLESIKNNKK